MDKKESFTFRVPSELREELQKRADAEGRTLSNYIVCLLQKAVKK